jgi:predicted nucleotidyltransferase component of viral defense system
VTLNLSFIRDVAAKQRFQAETVEKVLRLKQILVEFHRHPLLKGKLVLKGGTALNLFYLDLARLSVDIDLNYIGQAEREAMLSERPAIVKAVEQICGALGYQAQRGTDDYALTAWTLGYQNHSGRPDHAQIEINFLYRVCAQRPEVRASSRFRDETECSFPTLSIEELLAGKLTAMIDRQHPRDLYDLHRFMKENRPHDSEVLRKLAVLFGSTLPHDLRTYTLERCERILTADAGNLLYPLLRADDRPTAAEMLELVRPILAPILAAETEIAYLEALAAGRYDPQLLFPANKEMAERVRRHPALLWKAEHVAKRRAEKRTD